LTILLVVDIDNKKENKMLIKDGRGQHRKRIEEINKMIIENYFKKHPDSTRKECSEKTGLSVQTIRKHIRKIQAI